ncbi:MAG: PLP-dependent transferase [Chloroflexi bacterium]|nr:PLP-dependent transferase [Chloroflexota bacterium]
MTQTSDFESFETRAVHAGERGPRPDFTPVSTPVYRSVSYIYDEMEDLDSIFAGAGRGYVYGRYGNPTVRAFEQAVAALEAIDDAVACSTGMAAVHLALLTAGCRSGSHIVAAQDVYGATYALLARLLTTLGMTVRFVDITDLAAVQAALNEARPTVLVLETISNPLLKVPDVPRLTEMAHAAGAKVVLDNTFASPYLIQPAAFGVDVVLHSATKYLGGHGDVLAGVLALPGALAGEARELMKLLGPNLEPDTAWLALRGLKTLPLRMERHCANALTVAQGLKGHRRIRRVIYPGLPEHPQHSLASRLFRRGCYGGMVAFEIAGADQAAVFRFMEALRVVLPATSLGDVYSLTLYPAHSSHRALTDDERSAVGIGPGLVRLSVGVEDAGEILADLEQALAAAA